MSRRSRRGALRDSIGKGSIGVALQPMGPRVDQKLLDRFVDWLLRTGRDRDEPITLRDLCMKEGCAPLRGHMIAACALEKGYIHPPRMRERGPDLRLTREGYNHARAVARKQAELRAKALRNF